MANIKVSELPTATNFNDDDYTMIVQNNTTKKITKENMYGNYKYSTTENIIGQWIDGKPIYRKVINVGNLLPEGEYNTKEVAHNITNLDKVINMKCIAYMDDVYFDFNNYADGSLEVFVNNQNVIIVFNTNYPFANNAYTTIEYTKTTD